LYKTQHLERAGPNTNELAAELVVNTQAKTDCKEWHTDGWSGYERALCSDEIEHYVSKVLTQRVERTNGIVRQQTERTASTAEQV
jgi:IS1 family transposase